MAYSFNLLRSKDGLELFPEICLRVAEVLIEYDPVIVGTLLLLSKSFHSLLKCYEKSVTKALCENGQFEHVNVSQSILHAYHILPGDLLVTSQTYPWLLELQGRRNTIEFLINHELTEMNDLSESWPILNVPSLELQQRLLTFKRKAFHLLYRLADCTASCKKIEDMRAQQSRFLENLTLTQLASLGVMVEVMGQNYFAITKRMIIDSDLRHSLHLESHPAAAIRSSLPSSIPIADLMNDNWIRECMCVFEDLVQRFGPYFAWAYLEGSSERVRRPDLWARQMIQEGLDDMNAFELGYTMAYASLQSVVWRILCNKEGCSLQESWDIAKDLVETEMAGYKIKY